MAGKSAVIKRANELLAEVNPKSRVRSEHFDAIFRAIYELVREDTRVAVQHFGVFIRQSRAARRGWNPNIGKPTLIPESTKLMFRSRVHFDKGDYTS